MFPPGLLGLPLGDAGTSTMSHVIEMYLRRREWHGSLLVIEMPQRAFCRVGQIESSFQKIG